MDRSKFVKAAYEILRPYWTTDRRMSLVVIAVITVSSLASVAAPYLFSRLIDHLSHGQEGTALPSAIFFYPVLLGVVATLQGTVQYLAYMSAENVAFVTSTKFFERILRKSGAFFIDHNAAEIQNATARGLAALNILVQMALASVLPGVIQIVLSLIAIGAVLDASLVIIVAIYGATVVILTLFSAQRARVFLDRAVEAGQQNARFVGGAVNAVDTLRHFGSHRWMSERFSTKAREVRDNWRAYVFRRIWYVALAGLSLTIQFAVTFYLLLPSFEAGSLSIGNIVLFNTLLLQLNIPFEMIAHTIDQATLARATLLPLVTMWTAPEELRPSHKLSALLGRGRIVFDDVSYEYANGRGVSGITFAASCGNITFLTGASGAGKSTIFKLALKSVDPSKGRILVDGIDLASIDQAQWYAMVAIVPQDVMLLNESLEDNILLGRHRDEARLRKAAAHAAILQFIDALPEGFRTTVGEHGLRLSGGERQRIAIARALYGNPIILLLDEASSALDEATEHEIMAQVRQLATHVTVLAITHRQSVIDSADNIVRLASGDMQNV